MKWFQAITKAMRRKPKHDVTETYLKSQSITKEFVKYRLTDPGSTLIIREERLPSTPIVPEIQVGGFSGGGHEVNTPSGQAAGVYMTMYNAIQNYNEFAEKPLDKWSTVPAIKVMPRAGKNLNAYYNRHSIAFFMEKDVAGNDIFTADSPDIVAHELGHAILDSVRPDLWHTANLEVWAFHESYSDILSMISALRHPEVVQLVLDTTHGDIRSDNPVSCLAEQLAQTCYSKSKQPGGSPSWLRNAHNDFKYQSPITLPDEGPDDKIIAEPHNFSRVLTGALYECLVAIYEDEKAHGRDPVKSLLNAGKGLGWYVSRATTRTQNKGKFFRSFATSLLTVDEKISKNYYQDRFRSIFQSRNILTEDKPMLLSKEPRGTGKTVLVRLRDCLPLRAQCVNPLYDVNIQIADDGIYSILAAQDLVQYLHRCGRVSKSPMTPFQVCDGKLKRTHFSCCYRRNWENPTQPEYLKPPKPQNNAQPCGCRQKEHQTMMSGTRKIVTETNIRYKSGGGA